jgi:DNA-packaging protein gp3
MAAPKGNQYALGNEFGGVDKIFDSPGELQTFIQGYFDWCDNNPLYTWHSQLDKSTGSPVKIANQRPYTLEGLATHLGITSRTLRNYKNREGYEEFFPVIMWAKQVITNQRIECATIGAFKEQFTKFLLINNSDEYVDKVEQKVTNTNYNSEPLTKDQIKEISDALDGEI